VNWIDTAPAYGAGRSEEVVARAVRGVAEKPYIFTKCGDMPLDGRRPLRNLKAQSIRHEVEWSLRRLDVDAIDLCQIHQACPDEDIEEAMGMLASLQSEGKVRYIGVSNFDRAQLQRARAVATVTSIQPPYSMLTRSPLWEPPFHLTASTEALEHDVLPFCDREGIGVIVYSPLEQGLLAGSMSRERVASLGDDDWRRHDPRFAEPRLSRTLSLVEKLRVVAERHERSIGELAVAWVLLNPAVTGAIIGFRRAAQVDALLASA
jgi:aryl-alcohol dehydrogenase-like predicted oxidoreductase